MYRINNTLQQKPNLIQIMRPNEYPKISLFLFSSITIHALRTFLFAAVPIFHSTIDATRPALENI